jgi:prolyl-tRNA synthetase
MEETRAHAGCVCPFRRGVDGHAGDQRVKTASERFAGAVDTYCIEAMMQDGKACRPAPRTSSGRTSPRPSRCSSPTRRTAGARLGHQLGREHPPDGRADHDAQRRPRPGASAQAGTRSKWPWCPSPRTASSWRPSMPMPHPCRGLRAKGISVKFDNDDKKKPGLEIRRVRVQGLPRAHRHRPARHGERHGGSGPARHTGKAGDAGRRTSPTRWSTCWKPSRTICTRRRWPCARRIPMPWTATRSSRTDREGRLHPGPLGRHPETEARVKEETKATIRCIPFEGDTSPGTCMVTGQPSKQRVIFAKAY